MEGMLNSLNSNSQDTKAIIGAINNQTVAINRLTRVNALAVQLRNRKT